MLNENNSIHMTVTGATACVMVLFDALPIIAADTSDVYLSQGNLKLKAGTGLPFAVVTIPTRPNVPVLGIF
jgi:hypothetical protein